MNKIQKFEDHHVELERMVTKKYEICVVTSIHDQTDEWFLRD